MYQRRFLTSSLLTLGLLATIITGTAMAQAGNPCGAKAANPCGGKAANPCAMKIQDHAKMPAINPCFAKMGTVFTIADPMKRNVVTFKSQAPLEDIVGTTNEINGYVVFDPKNPAKGGRGEIVVPVASLKTGIPLRDEHLLGREWLDAVRHRYITFRIDEVTKVKKVQSGEGFNTYEMVAKGPFTLRGITRSLETTLTVTYLEEGEQTRQRLEGDLLAARTSFQVSLSDFDIKGFDGVVGSKVGKTIDIEVSLVANASSGSATGAANPCAGNPCGGKSRSSRKS